jgi:hypothetical protein
VKGYDEIKKLDMMLEVDFKTNVKAGGNPNEESSC